MKYLIGVLVAVVAVIVVMGLFNLLKGGSSSWSQKLMRLRVLVQLIAVIVIMAVLYFQT